MTECKTCDFEHPKHVFRATWLCPVCGRDYSLEYLLWIQAVHPEWFEEKQPTCTEPPPVV